MIWASSFIELTGVLNSLRNRLATSALVLPVRLLAPAFFPYRFGKFVASQLASVTPDCVGPSFRIRSWPSQLDQKLIFPVWPDWMLLGWTTVRVTVATAVPPGESPAV